MDATPFGHYQLQQLIGRGGMGEVYLAYDTKTDRVVALKVLPPHLAKDVTFQQRFRRESQAAAGINEPHVVPIQQFTPGSPVTVLSPPYGAKPPPRR